MFQAALLIIRSDCINTRSGIVFSVSDCLVCRWRRNWFLLNLLVEDYNNKRII